MDKRSQEYLDKILTKVPETLNSEERAFLRARRTYLKKAQLEEYDSILNPKVVSPEETKPAEKQTVKKHDKTNSK